MIQINKTSLISLGLLSLIATEVAFATDNGSEGKFMAKAKVLGVLSRYKAQKSLNVSIGAQNPTTLINQQNNYQANNTISYGSGFGVELAGSYFLTDHIAMELSAGFIMKKIKLSGTFADGITLNGDSYNTGMGGLYKLYTVSKLIPIDIIAQYHMAPYGKISPYLGIGYNYTFASASAGSRIGTSRGAVLQAGFDAFIYNDLLFSADLKKTLMTNKLDVNIGSTYGSFIIPTKKISLNPWTLSMGLGYRF